MRDSENALKPISPETKDIASPRRKSSVHDSKMDTQDYILQNSSLRLDDLYSTQKKEIKEEHLAGLRSSMRTGENSYSKVGIRIDFENRYEDNSAHSSSHKNGANDLNRSSLTGGRPMSILKNQNHSSLTRGLNSSRSSPIERSSRKKVNFTVP
jgi:hypothetical protein